MATNNLTNTVRLSILALLMGAFGAVIATGLTSLVSAHGGDQGLIHACVRDVPASAGPLGSLFSTLLRDGDVRIVDADEECKTWETALDWPEAGAGGLAGYEFHTTEVTADVTSSTSIATQASCTGDRQPLGGGFEVNSGAFYAIGSVPFYGVVSGWHAAIFNSSPSDLQVTFTVYVVCAEVGP